MTTRGSRSALELRGIELLKFLMLAVFAAWAAYAPAQSPAPAAAPRVSARVYKLTLHDTLQPASAALLHRALRQAQAEHAILFLLDLSTPGGLTSSTDAMVRDIRASRIPVVVFAGTPQTRVAGQGLRLLAAADVAAIGPDAYLAPLWSEIARGVSATERTDQSAMLALSWSQLQEARGRGTSEASNLASGTHWISSDEALRTHAVDLEPMSTPDLLRELNGRPVTRPDGTIARLDLVRPSVQTDSLTFTEAIARALMNPDLCVLLLTLGGLLIYLEINTPGIVIPGAAGLLLVLLSASALHRLPIRLVAVLLLVAALAFTFLETRFKRHGLLAILGIVSLTVGLAMLVKGPIPELEVGWGTAIGAGVGFGGITSMLIVLGQKARRAKVKTGADAMLGWLAVAYTPLSPEGQVLVRGELWRARLVNQDGAVPAGESVKVVRAEGQTLEVSVLPSASAM